MTTTTAPVLWFGAPSIATNSPNAAGQQFMTLFDTPSTWQVAAAQTYGFSLTESFILTATDAQLTEIFAYLKAHNMKMMMVAGMVPIQANGIGNGVEGFTTATALSQALNRIKSLGGTLDTLGMDAPLVAGCISTNGPRLSVTALAQQMASNVALVKSFFPSVQFEVGDGTNTTSLMAPFQQAFQAATGSTIAQFDADVNWNLPDNASQLAAFASAAQQAGALYGISGNATNLQPGNMAWTLAAEANVAAAEANPLTRPAFIHIGTWDAYPTLILPEGLSGTLAHVAAEISQFSPLYTSGYLTGGSGITVATTAPEQSYAGSAMDAVSGSAILVPGVQITASNSAGMTFAAVITDMTGMLNATASGAGKVTGAGTGVLTLTGSLADINAELASLTYTGVAAGTDTIDVTTYDGVGLVDDHLISVAIAAPITETVPTGMTAATLYQNIFGHAASSATLSAAQAAMNGGKTLAQVAAPWIAQGQATIEALYEQVRGVSPTASVLTSLTASLIGGQTVAQIRSSLASCAATQSELSALYQSHYGVAPTPTQLAALTQQLASGTSLEDVEAPLLANSQAETQVTTLFQQLEGVAPGATDLVTDARALLTGTSLATLRGALATSAVVQNNVSTLYQHVYDASPTTAQLAPYTAELSSGTTYAQVQAQFTAIAQSVVSATYQSVLNRAPSGAELSAYTQLLLAGTSTHLSIFANLAYSTASVANVTSMYQQVIGQAAPQTVLTALEQCLCIGPNQIPLAQLRTDLAAAATMYQQITGQTATADALTPLIYDYLNHASTTQIRTSLAYSAAEVTMFRNTYQQLFGTGITAATLTGFEQALVNGTTTMAAINTSLAAQAAADVPTISGVAASQTVTANSRVMPFGAVTIADPGTNQLETVTVALTGGGTLAGGGGGTLNAAHTAYTARGTPGIVAAGLKSLIFTPPTAGGTSQLTLTVQNGTGNHTSDTVAITSQTLKSPTATMFLYASGQSTSIAPFFANETIVFPASGFGVDTITGFSAAQGVIELPHAIAATFAAVQSHETASAGGTLISFSASESIFLSGIAPSSLHASNFAFA